MTQADRVASPSDPAPVKRHRRTPFGPVVGVVTALGGAAVVAYFAYLLVRNPLGFVLGFTLALIPLGALTAFYWWLDAYEREPRGLLIAASLWGGLAATGGALILNTLALNAIGNIAAVVEAPFVEEGLKGLFLLLLLWWHRDAISGLLDGVIYAGCVATGFAFVENITYFVRGYDGVGLPDQTTHIPGIAVLLVELLMRGVVTPFAHPLFTSMTGLGVAIAATTRHRALRWLAPIGGYLLAALLHGAWNGVLTSGLPALALPAFLLVYAPLWSTYLTLCLLDRRRMRDAAQSARSTLTPPMMHTPLMTSVGASGSVTSPWSSL